MFIEPPLYFSKHEQSFNLFILITHVCGQRVFIESYYIANNVYVTMPQAGFEPPKLRDCLLEFGARSTSKPPRLDLNVIYLRRNYIKVQLQLYL